MSANRCGLRVGCAAVLLVLLQGVSTAQTSGVAASFGEMPRKVKSGQIVIVIDNAGRKTRGKVVEASDSSLVILTRDQNNQWATREMFAPSAVREVKRTGPIWDKALVGLAIGVVPALFVEDCSGCASSGELALVWGGIGAGIGLGIDAALGPKLVYRAPGTRQTQVVLAPVVGHSRKGAMLALRF